MTTGDAPSLDDQLDRWVGLGLLSADQAERIREHEAQQPASRSGHRGSLVIEGLGYVGLVLVVIAAVTIAGRYWSDFGATGRLGLVFGAALVLVASGGAVTATPGSAGHRLRAVAWMLGVVAFGGGLALFADEVLDLQGEQVTLVAALGAGILAAVLWWRHRTVLQEAAVVASGAWAAGAAAASLPSDETSVVGLALWGWGTVWLLLGSARAGSGRAAADVCGGAVAVLGALLTVYTDAGSALALATAAVLVLVGVIARDLVLLGVGSVATLAAVPVVMSRWFPDTLVAPVALLVAGVVLVAGAVLVARRRRAGPPTGPTGSWSPGAGPAAVAAAAAGLVVAAVVVVLGLG